MKRSSSGVPVVVEEGRHLYIGKPCRHGHLGLRYRANRCCVECTRERAAAARQVVKHDSLVEADIDLHN